MSQSLRTKRILWKGKWQEAHFLKEKNTLWLHIDGEILTYQPDSAIQRMEETFNYGPMKSPMPGKIIKTYAQEGKNFEANQTLVVLEAMKMEYTIKAPKEVCVSKLLCKEGEQVSEGQVLLEVEKV